MRNEFKGEALPGGIAIVSGGTRTKISLNRPWQTQIVVDPSTCPFETTEQQEESSCEIAGWRVIANKFTPLDWHKLIIPTGCWPVGKLRILGGQENIEAAVTIAKSMISKAPADELWLGVHVGPSAGQNIGHLHYHLLRPMDRIACGAQVDDVRRTLNSSPSRVIFEDKCFTVLAGGVRAGQCFFFPRDKHQPTSKSVAETVVRIITLYNSKFQSEQGMAPDYMLGILFRRREFMYGAYIPALNNWGFTEYLGLTESRALLLPWTHDETVRYLREE